MNHGGTVSKKFRIVVRQLQHGSSWPSPKISFHSPVTLSNFCPTSFLRFIFSHILAFTSEISLLTVEINKKKKKEKINQFSRNWLIKITREEKKSRYKAYTDERRKLETLSHSLSFRTKRGGKEGVEEK